MFKSVNSNAQFLKVIYFQKLVSLKESYSFLNLLCDLIFYFNPIQKLWIISWSISEWFYRLSCEFYFGSETMWNIKSCLTFLTTGNFLFIKEILFDYKIKKRKKKQNKKTINSDQIFSLFLSFIFFFSFFFQVWNFFAKARTMERCFNILENQVTTSNATMVCHLVENALKTLSSWTAKGFVLDRIIGKDLANRFNVCFELLFRNIMILLFLDFALVFNNFIFLKLFFFYIYIYIYTFLFIC